MLTGNNDRLLTGVDRIFPEMSPTLRYKTESLLKEIKSFAKVIVAFSGGVDSTLVTYFAKVVLDENAIAVTADSPSLPAKELDEARQLAKEIGIKHIIIRTDQLEDPSYLANPTNRCYFCKKELSKKLSLLASDIGISVIIDGTNADDLKGHRPGATALSEQGVRRPLSDVGMTKADVRELSRLLGLPNYDKPSMPCLSSRVQYGQVITPERLWRIERSENFIRSVTGVKDLRVRDHGNSARIEVGRDERHLFFNENLLDRIANELHEFGFTYTSFDLLGYRSGSMNEPIIHNVESEVEPRK